MQNSKESKKKWFGKQKHPNSDSTEAVRVASPPQPKEANIIHSESEENNEPCYDEVASAATQAYEASVSTIEPNVATPFAAAEVVQLSTQTHISSPPKEEVAAIKIQTVFRGYLVIVPHNSLALEISLNLVRGMTVEVKNEASFIRV